MEKYQQGQLASSLPYILRELVYQIDASPKQKQWAEPMKKLMLEIKAAVDEAKEAGKKKLEGKQRREFNKRYKELSRKGMGDEPGDKAARRRRPSADR